MRPDARIGIGAGALLSPLTGIGRYTFHLVSELQQLLPRPPILFYGAGWSESLRSTPLPAFAAAAKDRIARLIPRPYLVSRYLMQRRFDAGARDLDLYHEPNYLAFGFAGPTVVTIHDLSWVRYPGMHPRDRVRLMNAVMPRVVRDAAHIVVDSDFVRGEVVAYYGVRPEKVTTVPLGVSEEFTPAAPEAARATLSEYGLLHGEYLLAVGTLEPRKNLAMVIDAYSRLAPALRRRYPLIVAGMQGWGTERMPAAIKELVARGEVRFLGFVSQRDLPRIYSGARLFIYPSIYEGFGLPPLEAMACGVPVIVSGRASLPEVVADAGVIVDPDDGAALASKITDLLEDPALLARLAQAGLVRARHFSWRRCALETLAVYGKAIQ